MTKKQSQPHDSFYTYTIIATRVWVKILPALKHKSTKGDLIIRIMLIIMAAMGGVFGGFFIQTNYLSPPANVYGVCPPPAYVSNGGCFQKQSVINQNGQNQTISVPGGYIITATVQRTCNSQGTCVSVNTG